jgi:predicted  nucleic acid-binding Zn-ribbon protein
MDEQLNLLIQLQEIDGRIRVLSDQQKRLPAAIAELDAKRSTNRAVLDAAKNNLQAAQKNKRDRDQELEAGVQKVEKLKAHSAEIKNNKEYQALLKEIETGEKDNKAIEDSILGLMEKIDNATAEIGVAEQRVSEGETAIAQEQKELEASFAQLGEELKAMGQSRTGIVNKVEPSILSHYQRMFDGRNGVALAEARGESCSGCFMSIPPQVFVNVKKNASIINCPQCGRILYYKEAIVQK